MAEVSGNKIIILLQGLPASGKSTYVKDMLARDKRYKRINRDELRLMIDNGVYTPENEENIKNAELSLAGIFLNTGYIPVIDDCNLAPHTITMWREFARKMRAGLAFKGFTHVSVEECIERDRNRPHPVGEQVIQKMYDDYLAPKIEAEKGKEDVS